MESNAILLKQYHSALEKLQKSRDTLEEEVSQLRHELRRVRDGVERMSGIPHVLQQQASQLVCLQIALKNNENNSLWDEILSLA